MSLWLHTVREKLIKNWSNRLSLMIQKGNVSELRPVDQMHCHAPCVCWGKLQWLRAVSQRTSQTTPEWPPSGQRPTITWHSARINLGW